MPERRFRKRVIFLVAYLVFAILPVYWMVNMSFKTNAEILSVFSLWPRDFTLAHYRSSIEADPALSELWKDVFLFHWKEESQHATLDELEWRREDARLRGAERDRGVDDLIELVGAVDGICRVQAEADADYFMQHARRPFSPEQIAAVLLA